MKTFKTTFKTYIISSNQCTERTPAPWMTENLNKHLIRVYNKNNKKSFSFDFWASIAQPVVSTREQLLDALECFLSDALSGKYSFDDFCEEFGYNNDSIKAYKTWKACKNALKRANRVLTDSICNLIEEIQKEI